MLQEERKYFAAPDGGGNFDDAPFAVKLNQFVNMENCRIGTTDAGETGTVESIGATILINNPNLPAGNNIQIGSAEDEAEQRAVYFLCNDTGLHTIQCYDDRTGLISLVLSDVQVTGGLNFDKDHLIHSVKIMNGHVYWTDYLNEPHRVDINAGLALNGSMPGYPPYTSPLTQSVIAWARRQPGLPPTQTKVLVTPAPTNIFIGDEAFQFAYRYQYRGYEYSTLSGLSDLADFNESIPPPQTTSLNIPNVIGHSNNYFYTIYQLPPNPTPAYGPGVFAKITRVGTAGANAQATDINIPLNWVGYPGTRSYNRVIVEGLNSYFSQLPGNGNTAGLTAGPNPQTQQQGGNWYISYRDHVHPDIVIAETWDWGLGDHAFAPTVEANLTLYTVTPGPSKQFTYVNVAIPLGEKIDQDVIQVDLIANYLVSNVYFIIQSWRKGKAADAAAIAAHNAGTTQLSYNFYNNKAGIALDPAYAVKPYDSIPWLCETIEIAKYRSFMANIKIGYNSIDLITSLTVSPVLATVGQPVSGTITGEWFLFKFFNGAQVAATLYSEFIIRTTQSVTPQPFSPYYYYTTANAAPPFPGTISTGLIFLGTTYVEVMAYYLSQNNDIQPGSYGSVIDQNVSSALVSQNQTLNFGVLAKAFKANAPYQACVTFYDNYGRKWGAITNDNLLFSTPNTGFSSNQYATSVAWTLSNANALNEIPAQAFYYSVDITKCLRTRFFIEGIGFVVYADKDASNNYTFTETAYSPNQAGVAINISFLANNSMGYVFSEGDIVNFYLAGNNYSLAIIGQAAQYIICQLQDVGALTGGSLCQFEIFTPYKKLSNEPFYEIGQIYPIVAPGTTTRTYSLLAGNLNGDVFLFQRQNSFINYIAEAMSPNDKFYKLWYTDSGRPNFLDYIGETDQENSGAFSNTLVQGSKVNGLSTYDALDTFAIYLECGAIQKLQLTAKVSNEQGSIMLAICEDETASVYLGESQLVASAQNADIAISNNVIGTINVLKGSFGTINPESVCEFRGNVFWVDVKNGKVIQYSTNGLFPISNYKMTRFWKLFCGQYLSMSQAQIEALGSRPFIFSTVDPHNWELLISVPKLLQAPPKGYLPDYPAMIYPFDIWDGQAKTLVYKISADPNRWDGSFLFATDGFSVIGNKVFSSKNGQFYLHNSISDYTINLYGTVYKARIMFIANNTPNRPKVYNNMAVEANYRPSLSYFRTEPSLVEFEQYDLNEQASDLMDFDYTVKEGQLYATLYRNKLVPTATGLSLNGLLTAEKIRALTLKCLLEFTPVNQPLELKFVTLGFELSLGHRL